MHGQTTAISRVADALKECLSETEVLRTIDEFFGDLGFDFDQAAEDASRARGVAQRRSRAAGYLDNLDLDERADRARLLDAIAAKLSEWTEERGPSPDRVARLKRTLRAAGYEWNGTAIQASSSSSASATRTSSRPSPPLAAETTGSTANAPSVFISYAHEDAELAHALAGALRSRGCRVWIDVDEMRIGDDLASRIGEAIDSVDFLLAVISDTSVKSPWCKRELSIAVSEAMKSGRVKVLPMRLGPVALPALLRGIYSPRVDPSNVGTMAEKLLADMEGHRGPPAPAPRPTPPPTDIRPTLSSAPTVPPAVDPVEPIRIIGVDAAGVTRPRMDGTRGSGLYTVPLRLNRTPTATWARRLPGLWDHPPEFTTMHRPGIASVSGDRIVLNGTTMEEVERYHAATLRKVIQEVNRLVLEEEAAKRLEREHVEADERAHDESVRTAAERIKFD